MNTPTSVHRPRSVRPGVTLIELTVIIFVLLTLMSVLFVGARAWIRGSDRATCIAQIRNVQVSVRSFSNLNGLNPGADTGLLNPPVALQGELIGDGKFLESAPDCPANGQYTLDGNNIPAIGSLYMTCSLEASEEHVPDRFTNW